MCSSFGAALAWAAVFSCFGSASESPAAGEPAEQSNEARGIVKAVEIASVRDLLARFKVPEKSISSKDSPVRVEAQLVRAIDRPPFLLRGYILIPRWGSEKAANSPLKAKEFLRLPFGHMDVVAPLTSKQRFVLFPYDDEKLVRERLQAGDVVLVGVEAVPVEAGIEDGKRLNVDIMVRRVVAW